MLTSTCTGCCSSIYGGSKSLCLFLSVSLISKAITILPILIVTKAPVTLFITLFLNAMKIRRDTNIAPFLLYINNLTHDVICNIAIYADDTTFWENGLVG